MGDRCIDVGSKQACTVYRGIRGALLK